MALFSKKINRIHFYKFPGRMALEEFLRLRCIITRHPDDKVRRKDFYSAYRKFCIEKNYTIASVVCVGRLLGRKRIWASARVGGRNGKDQEYAYVGLHLKGRTPRRKNKIRKLVKGGRRRSIKRANSRYNKTPAAVNSRIEMEQAPVVLKADSNETVPPIMQEPLEICTYSSVGTLNTINNVDLEALGFQIVPPDEILKENIGDRKHEPLDLSRHSPDSSYNLNQIEDAPLMINKYSINNRQEQSTIEIMSPCPNPPTFSSEPSPSKDNQKDNPKPSSSTKKPSTSSSRENIVNLFDSFLRDHIRYTGSQNDAVPLEEVHEGYRRWCLERGIKPPRYDTVMVHLAPRVGVPIDHISFEVKKEAYLGVEWSSLPPNIRYPSKKIDPTKSCANCQMRYYPGSTWEYNHHQGGRYLIPWVADEHYTNPLYQQERPFTYSNAGNYSSSSNVLQPIQQTTSYQQVNLPHTMPRVPSPPDTQPNLYQMIDDFVTNDPHAF